MNTHSHHFTRDDDLPRSTAVATPRIDVATGDIHEIDYLQRAKRMGYTALHSGDWHHARLGFDVQAVRWAGGRQRVNRYMTLFALEDHLAAERQAVSGRRFIAALLVGLALFAALLIAAWPARAAEARPLLTLQLDGGEAIARCDEPYLLAAGATATVTCLHPGTQGRARIATQSGNAWVLASVAVQRHRPGYAIVSLHNTATTSQGGVAVVEFFAP
jgi:hypothetical protein